MRLPLVVLVIAALTFVSGCEPSYPGVPLGTYSVVETLETNTCGAGLPVLPTVSFDVELRASGAVGYWRMRASGPVTGSYREADGAFEFRGTTALVAWATDLPNGIAGCTLEQRETIRGTVTPILTTADGAAGDGAAGDGAIGDGAIGDGAADETSLDAGLADAGSALDAGSDPLDAGNAADAGHAGDAGTSALRVLLVGEHLVDVVVARGSDCGALLAVQGGSFDAMPCRVRYTLSGVASDSTF